MSLRMEGEMMFGKKDKQMKNLTGVGRAHDDIYQEDIAKATRERGTDEVYDRGATKRANRIIMIVTATLGTIFVAFVLSTLFATIYNMLMGLKEGMTLPGQEPKKVDKLSEGAIFKWFLTGFQIIVPFTIAMIVGYAATRFNNKHSKKRALFTDHTDINTYADDRHLATPDEIASVYMPFPDAGAHSKSVTPASIISHIMIQNHRSLPKVTLAERDAEGNILYDENGKMVTKTYPMFDEDVQEKVWESVGVLDRAKRKTYDPTKVRIKRKDNGKWFTLADHIKEDWFFPVYEYQRPAGVFFVETGAVNTFAIAITRGNKGQLVVNNTIDNLSREGDPQNMFINDPKGELLAGFFKILEFRGYELVVLNLIEPSNTHQFNVLGPAITLARIGDYDKMRSSLNTIMNTFFPVEGDDPFWGNAQQTLIRMMIFSLFDYYIEEEREYLQRYNGVRDPSTIARDLDDMWARVTMFNVYQMLTTMSRDEVEFQVNPTLEDKYSAEVLAEMEQDDPEGLENLQKEYEANKIQIMGEGEKMTRLTAFFKLTSLLPNNKMRTITMQQSDAMSLMADSEKTRATVYGIALVAMLFFTDGPITAITSASPKQSLDPISLAFPRRLRFKINGSFLKAHKLAGAKVIFESYYDEAMKDKLQGPDFEHTTKLDQLGWVEYRFKGIYENIEEVTEPDGTVLRIPKPIYIRMKIQDRRSGLNMYTFDFEFTRGYAKAANGRTFLQNPRTGERIMQHGTLRIGRVVDGKFQVDGMTGASNLPNGMKNVLPIEQTDAVYNIQPKAIFSITPPNLTDYIKVVIVMVAVLFDTSVGESYITKDNQKPFYKIRSILDELGNMAFNGNGIPEFQTKLSIGLGQGLHSCPAYL